MKIKSFGCSFIFGSDLSDLSDHHVSKNPVGTFSNLTWPAVLAKNLGFEYECHARPGSGNLQIAERVMNQCAQDRDSIFVIDWTWIDRFDYIKSDDFWQPWETIRPSTVEPIAKTYYSTLHSEYKDKLNSLLLAKSVIDILLEKNITFIMTYEDELMFDQHWHVSSAVIHLQNYVKPFTTTFEGMTFLNWSRSKGHKESHNWHPLEQAHQEAANYIRDTNKLKLNTDLARK
jgi:hypothetical protein